MEPWTVCSLHGAQRRDGEVERESKDAEEW